MRKSVHHGIGVIISKKFVKTKRIVMTPKEDNE
jgi:hypothetical protein